MKRTIDLNQITHLTKSEDSEEILEKDLSDKEIIENVSNEMIKAMDKWPIENK